MATLETDLVDRHRAQGCLSPAEQASLALLALLLAVNVYRAASQSMTHDEAYAWSNFLTGSITHIFTTYHVNNHVLQSALSWFAFHWFGFGEFTLRLPSVLGGLLYFLTSWRLSRLLFGGGWFHVISVLALCLNPFVLDYLSAARGYGLGVGLLLWAFYHLCSPPEPAHLWRAGVGLGLSVAATLVFLYPAVALGSVALLLLVLDGAFKGRAAAMQRLWLMVDQFAGPALITAFVLLVIPLTRVQMDYFYYGAPSLAQFSRTLVDISLFHNPRIWKMGAAFLPFFGHWPAAFELVIVPALVSLAIAAALVLALRVVRRRNLALPAAADYCLLLAGAAMAVLLAMLLVSHYVLHLPYPQTRTGIYWAPLVTLGALCLAYRFHTARLRWAAFPVFVVLLAAIGFFAAGFTTTYYNEWPFDRSTRRIVNIIRQRERAAPHAALRVAADWLVIPSLDFYRRRYRLARMEMVDLRRLSGYCDYYVLLPPDHGLIAGRHLLPLYRDEIGGEVLAIPPQP